MTRLNFNRVRTIIAEELDVEPKRVTMNAQLRGDNLGADSLDLISLIVAFATEFNIEMRDEEVMKIVTVGDLVNYLERCLVLQSQG